MENRAQIFCSISLLFFQRFDHDAALKMESKMSHLNIAFDRYASYRNCNALHFGNMRTVTFRTCQFSWIKVKIRYKCPMPLGAGDAEDATTSFSKIFWVKLIRFWEIWLDSGTIVAKFGQSQSEIWAKVIGFGKNQNLASRKIFDLLQSYCYESITG